MHNPASSRPALRAAVLVQKPGLRTVLLVVAFVFCCSPALRALVRTWSEQDLYSYGFLVPVISLFWIRQDHELLARLPATPSLFGGTLLLTAGGALLLPGFAGSMGIIQELAVVVIVHALVLLLLGGRFLRAVALPLGYLVLMVPVLDPVVEALHWPFQLFAAEAAEAALSLAGVPVFRSQQYLELPNVTLEVARACSGVRYLVSTMVLSIPLLFMTQKSRKGRLLLLLLALVLAIGANPLRVTLAGLWAYFGHGDVHGPSHLLQGYAVYMVGLFVLFAGAWLLQRIIPAPLQRDLPQRENESETGASIPRRVTDAWLLAFGLLLGLGLFLHLYAPERVPLTRGLDELPPLLSEWRLAPSAEPATGPSVPDGDAGIARVYRNSRGGAVTLRISYFESQQAGKNLFSAALLPLQEKSEPMTFVDAAGRTAALTRSVLPDQAGRPMVILSWYRINGRNRADRYAAKGQMAINGILSRHTNGALVMVSAFGEGDQPERDAAAFAAELLPVLEGYIP